MDDGGIPPAGPGAGSAPAGERTGPAVFTIGHSNLPLEEFLSRLARHGIEVVVDVRSRPFARFATHFDAGPLKAAIEAAGARYLFLGRELGGRPDGDDYYDAAGHVRYDRVAVAPLFLAGIERLERGIARYRVALLCSEGDPAGCHRHLLIGRVLEGRGVAVRHIGADGGFWHDPDAAGRSADAPGAPGQMALFDAREVTPWRSIRSVSPRSQPPSSSKP